jgi:hypothetical protein
MSDDPWWSGQYPRDLLMASNTWEVWTVFRACQKCVGAFPQSIIWSCHFRLIYDNTTVWDRM